METRSIYDSTKIVIISMLSRPKTGGAYPKNIYDPATCHAFIAIKRSVNGGRKVYHSVSLLP